MNAQFLRLLAASVDIAYMFSLGHRNHDRFHWFKNIEPGHLVMETTTIHQRGRDAMRFGTLISADFEPMFSDDEWAANHIDWGYTDGIRPTEKVYRIKLLTDGTEQKWTNANFVRVPEDTDLGW